jgi:hypothetical protein
MKALTCTLLAAGALTAALSLGTGTAAADDYAGKTYGDASSAIGDANEKAVVVTRSGDILDEDKCVVTRSEQAPWIKGDDFTPVTDTVLLSLDCNAGVASATTPGNSAASPEGKAAIEQAKEQAAQDQQTASDNQTKAKG